MEKLAVSVWNVLRPSGLPDGGVRTEAYVHSSFLHVKAECVGVLSTLYTMVKKIPISNCS